MACLRNKKQYERSLYLLYFENSGVENQRWNLENNISDKNGKKCFPKLSEGLKKKTLVKMLKNQWKNTAKNFGANKNGVK